MSEPSGIILLDKPAGLTSYEALAAVKRGLGTRKVGHTGTLDRFATGLLVVVAGGCTPLAQLFEGLDKTYTARAVLGTETDTLDPEGEVVATGPAPTPEGLSVVLPAFRGEILQVPPAYSAIHVDGGRAYQAARAGVPPAMVARSVTVLSLEILAYDPPLLDLRVRCTRGTYIRALARDLARAAGSCAHLRELRRTALGDIGVDEAVSPATFDPGRDLQAPSVFLRRHAIAPLLEVSEDQARALRLGRTIPTVLPRGPDTGVCVDPAGEPVALVRRERGSLRPVRVLGR